MKQQVKFVDHPLWLCSERGRLLILLLASHADNYGTVSMPDMTLFHRANFSVEGGHEGIGYTEARHALEYLMGETNDDDKPYVYRDENGHLNVSRIMDEVSDLFMPQRLRTMNKARVLAYRARKSKEAADV
jgi:hypothetical protein